MNSKNSIRNFITKITTYSKAPGQTDKFSACSRAKISSVPDTSAPHIGQHSPNL